VAGVKNRPSSTTSERELICAMAKSGRTISLATLAGWRREGLLPPFASHGLGMGKGKSYYWRENDILGHASAAFDFLRKYQRPEHVVWMLWLSGFSVPLPQFRRVWSSRSKARKTWIARPALAEILPSPSSFSLGNPNGATALLLETILALGGSLVPDDGDSASIVKVIERALAWMSRANVHPDLPRQQTAEQLWLIIRIVSSALENSDLVSIASDDELREAQRYIRLAGVLLSSCDDHWSADMGETTWPAWLAERMSAPVFLVILVLLRSGHAAALEQVAARLEKMDRRVRLPSIQRAYSAA
jgi:hypothetical protein